MPTVKWDGKSRLIRENQNNFMLSCIIDFNIKKKLPVHLSQFQTGNDTCSLTLNFFKYINQHNITQQKQILTIVSLTVELTRCIMKDHT